MTQSRMYPGTGPDERTTFEPYSAFDIPADLRELHGRYDVEAIAQRVRNFRYAEEWTMMILGGWVATVPEVPVKTGLGKIIWETAEAGNKLGLRLPELHCGRKAGAAAAAQAANKGFADFVQAIAEPESPDLTIEKLVGVFDVLKPHLIETYTRTQQETDQISDAPTVKILDEIVHYQRQHVAWGKEVLDRLCDTDGRRERRRRRARELGAMLELSGGVTGELRGRAAGTA